MRAARIQRRSSRAASAAALALAALCSAACRAAPEPAPLAPPPSASVDLAYHPGLVLGGGGRYSDAAPLDPDPSAALSLTCELFFLDELPPTTLPPLAMRAELVASIEGFQPMLSASRLFMRCSAGSGEEAVRLRADIDSGVGGRVAGVPAVHAALPIGATAMFMIRGASLASQADGSTLFPERQFAVLVGRSDEALSICLTASDRVEGRAAARPDEPLELEVAERGRSAERPVRLELVVLPQPLEAGGPPFAVIGPSPFQGEASALAVFVSAAPAPGAAEPDALREEHAQAVARCLEDAAENVAAAAARSEPGSIVEARERGLATVLEGLPESPDARATLVSLSSAAGAHVALDLALVASDDVVERLASEVTHASARPAGEHLGWFLDRSALAVAARTLMDAGGPLHELEAQLLVQTGQLGRFPNAVLEALAASVDRAAFDDMVLTENLGFLRDTDPGARVRAYDWLEQSGAAPEGYDPLADADARRAALWAAETRASAATERERASEQRR